ncbi:chemotaxis protein CheW [Spirochaetota bacterium]
MDDVKEIQNEVIHELMIFKVHDVLCGLNNIRVKEINRNTRITDVPHSPPYVRGVINLRGDIVTIIDMRVTFGFESIEINEDMRVVVVEFMDENVGLLTDRVLDIIPVDGNKFEAPPAKLLKKVSGDYFMSIYKRAGDLIAVIDIEKILQK